jgi:hypothetical protein
LVNRICRRVLAKKKTDTEVLLLGNVLWRGLNVESRRREEPFVI